jgi:quaternary ammonium compound-resistance protein SugE
MAWVYLVLASVFEIAGAIFLKNADGFTRLGPTVLTVASMTTSIVFLGFAMRTLSMGSAYAIWTGVGVVGVAFLGIQMFGESSSPVRLVSISLIVAGVVSVKLME